MPDYTPETWETGDTFDAADATAMSQELEEGEVKDAAQDAAITALQAELSSSYIVAESTIGNPISLLDQTFPATAIGFVLNAIMPGPGGASGRRGAAGTVRNGGAPGGGAGMVVGLFVPKPVGAHRWHANIPSPGVGGAAVTADNTNGNPSSALQGGQNGGAYGRVWITDESATVLWEIWFYPGAVAAGGTNTTMAAVGGGFGLGFAGTSGAAPGNGAAGSTSGANGTTPCAGGAGGSISAADAPFNGSPGGWSTPSGVSIPVAGTTAGVSPTAGTSPKRPGVPGNGGSGGAASITGAAQAGADAIGYGGGGGGGGASLNSNNSGKGGNGGPGWLCVEMVYA